MKRTIRFLLRLRTTALLLSLLVLAACAQPGPKLSDRETISTIAVCGAGLDERVKAAAEAVYSEHSIGGFAEISHHLKAVLDPNLGSSEKYKAYLECVKHRHDEITEARARQRKRDACKASCEATRNACDIESKRVFDSCIARELRGCISDCKQYVRKHRLWHVNDCHTDYCNWNKMKDDTKSLHVDRCMRRERYLEQVADCGSDYNHCLAAC